MSPTPTAGAGSTTGSSRAREVGHLGERTVARIGYGAMQLERLRGERAAAIALVHRAVELGVDHIDTAQFYGDGFVNDVLAEALHPDDQVVVVSKIGADPDPGGPFPMRAAQRPEELRASVQDNLRSLHLDQIPVVNLRRMDGRIRIPMPNDQVVDVDDQLAAMTAMRDEGLIGAIGLSNVSLDVLRRSIPAGIICVQNHYSLLARQDEDMLELCRDADIAWVPFFPLGSAMAMLPKVTDEPAVQQAAASLGVTPSQIGLAWLLHHAPNCLLIPGTANAQHLKENLAAAHLTLDAPTLRGLDALADPPSRTPR